MVNVNSLIFCS